MQPIFIRPQRPRRDLRLPILVLGVAGLLFTLVNGYILVGRWRDITSYLSFTTCAETGNPEPGETPCRDVEQPMTVSGASSYVETHSYLSRDVPKTLYALQLRDAGGKIVTVRGINARVGQEATIGKTATAVFWRGKLTDIRIDGQKSETSENPFKAAERAIAPTFIGFFIVSACGIILGTLKKTSRRGF